MNRILVLEDDKSIQFGLKEALEREKYEVLIEGDGEKGYKKAVGNNPDLIILDISLPAKDGFEICSGLRNNNIYTPIIMLTARKNEGDRVMGLEIGADDYVTKPFSVRELMIRVKKLLEKKNEIEKERSEKTRILKDLEAARSLQESFFPIRSPDISGFKIDSICYPCWEVGGDWYDYIPLSDGNLAVVIADVSGKGLGASLLMSSTRSLLRIIAEKVHSPKEVMVNLNHILMRDLPNEKFVTMIYSVIDSKSKSLTYCNAGHPPPLLVNSNNTAILENSTGLPLGIIDMKYSETTLNINHGSLFILYSDGVTEAMNPSKTEFGTERLLQIAVEPEISARDIYKKVIAFRTNKSAYSDDITISIIKRI